MKFLLLQGLALFSACGAYAAVTDLTRTSPNDLECLDRNGPALYRYVPGCRHITEYLGRKVEVAYNQLGLRDRDYSLRPAPGTMRILVVSHSALVGLGLKSEETPLRLLEKMWNAKGSRVEIINASTRGYGVLQNAIRLREYLDAYSPQLVVFFLPLGKKSFADYFLFPDLLMENGQPSRLELRSIRNLPEGVRNFLWNRQLLSLHHFLFDQSRKTLGGLRLRFLRGPGEHVGEVLHPTLLMLDYMKNLTEAKGARFLLFTQGGIISNHQNVSQYVALARVFDAVTPHVELDPLQVRAAIQGWGIPLIEMPALSNSSDFFENDYHFNVTGARIWASQACSYLCSLYPAKRKR